MRQVALILAGMLIYPSVACAQEGKPRQDPPVIFQDDLPPDDKRPRSETVLKHDDGTVTTIFTPVSMSPSELMRLLESYASESGGLKAARTSVLVRDKAVNIKEMEAIAKAFDPIPEASRVIIKVVWGTTGTQGKGGAELKSRTMSFNTILGSTFTSNGSEPQAYPSNTQETTGLPTKTTKTTLSFKQTGVRVEGTVKRVGGRLHLALTLELSGIPRGEWGGLEAFQLTAVLTDGEERVVGSSVERKGKDGKDPTVEVLITAKVSTQ